MKKNRLHHGRVTCCYCCDRHKIDLIREEETIRIRCDFPMTVYYKKQKLDCCKGENIFAIA